jgi:methionyl-tRNA synthetase
MCAPSFQEFESFKPEDIVGKKSDCIGKLGSRNLRWVESQGMILMTTNAEGKLAINPDTEAANERL